MDVRSISVSSIETQTQECPSFEAEIDFTGHHVTDDGI